MSRDRILQHAAYGQRPEGVTDAQWTAMVKQALADHQWHQRLKDVHGDYLPWE